MHDNVPVSGFFSSVREISPSLARYHCGMPRYCTLVWGLTGENGKSVAKTDGTNTRSECLSMCVAFQRPSSVTRIHSLVAPSRGSHSLSTLLITKSLFLISLTKNPSHKLDIASCAHESIVPSTLPRYPASILHLHRSWAMDINLHQKYRQRLPHARLTVSDREPPCHSHLDQTWSIQLPDLPTSEQLPLRGTPLRGQDTGTRSPF
jgi:hypothetical protein